MTFADWLDETTPERREVAVCFDRRLLSALTQARESLEHMGPEKRETLGDTDPERLQLQAHIDQLEAQVIERSHPIVFEGIGWQPWRDLIAKHPPKREQADVFAKAVQLAFMPHAIINLSYDAETFVPAAISASAVEPDISVADATRMLSDSPPGVLERIWTAVLEVNLAGNDDPLAVVSRNGSSVVHLASATR